MSPDAEFRLGDVRHRIRLARAGTSLLAVMTIGGGALTGRHLAAGAILLGAMAALYTVIAILCTIVLGMTLGRLRAEEAAVLREVRPRPCLSPPAPAAGPCTHPEAVPVDLLVTGETVAWLCPGCGDRLPAGFVPPRRHATADEAGERLCGCLTCALRLRGEDW